MSGKGRAGKAGKGRAAADDDDAAAAAAALPDGPREFGPTADALDFLSEQALDTEGYAASKAALAEYTQLSPADRKALQADTVRFVALKLLGSGGVIKAADVTRAVLRPGAYGDPKHIKGPYLLPLNMRPGLW